LVGPDVARSRGALDRAVGHPRLQEAAVRPALLGLFAVLAWCDCLGPRVACLTQVPYLALHGVQTVAPEDWSVRGVLYWPNVATQPRRPRRRLR
jgi:hypothetical protein